MTVSQADLMKMPKDELADETMKLANRLQNLKEKTTAAAQESVDFLAAGLGGGGAGYWMGSVQREINAGTEGYDEEAKKIMGVDKDLLLGLGLAGLSYVKGMKKYKAPVRQAGIGALSFFTGRKAYEYALERPSEEEDVEE